CAEKTDVHRSGAFGASLPHPAQRNPALARPLAQRHRHRCHERAAGALLGHGRQRVANRDRLAAAGNTMDQALSDKLGAAPHRALDPKRSKPWKPWHPLTRKAQEKVVPGEINEYAIEIMATANLFRKGHRICVEIASADMPTGVGGATNAEYIPNHVCSSRTTLHKIYHDARR